MGVPKFYRWVSERYPCLSEIVRENQVGKIYILQLDDFNVNFRSHFPDTRVRQPVSGHERHNPLLFTPERRRPPLSHIGGEDFRGHFQLHRRKL